MWRQQVIQSLHPDTQGRRIVWQIAPLPTVNADANLLRAALTNLFSNAVKFTRSREEATIQMGRMTKEEQNVGGESSESLPVSHSSFSLLHSALQDDQVALFIRDNGVGFDLEYVEKLFGVFQRLRTVEEFEGTGIGLANVRRIIARHGSGNCLAPCI